MHHVKIVHIEKWAVTIGAPLIYLLGQKKIKNVKTVYLLCRLFIIQVVIVLVLKIGTLSKIKDKKGEDEI